MRTRIERILLVLDQAETVSDMNIPGYWLHPLTGDRKGRGVLALPATGGSPSSLRRVMCWMLI